MHSFRPNIERIDNGICLKNVKYINKNACAQDKVTRKIVIKTLLVIGGFPWALALGFPCAFGFTLGFAAGSAKVC